MRALSRLLIGLLLVPSAFAEAAQSRLQQPLTFHFESFGSSHGGKGLLDVGRVSAKSRGRHSRTTIVRERIALRLEGGLAPPPSARVFVALGMDVPGVTVRVDGTVITTMPTLIDAVHRVGTRVMHQVELTIAADVPEGAFLHDLRWSAETD